MLSEREGLSDEEILDLTPMRLLQKVRTHLKRQNDERLFQIRLAETQTRVLAMWMSQSEKALSAATGISFIGDGDARIRIGGDFDAKPDRHREVRASEIAK